MLHPVGPLPASVYWRRRALAGVAVLLVILLGWVALPHGDGGTAQDAAAASGATPAVPTVPAGGVPTSLAASPPAYDPGRAGGSDGYPTTTSTTTTPAPAPGPAVAPVPCTDRMLVLRVAPKRTSYPVGAQPVVDLRIRNVSTVPCIRDLGVAQQEVLLYAGQQRLWSSNDCYSGGEPDMQVLPPGQLLTFSVTWSGLSSRQHCAGQRARVGAGKYLLLARLGTLISPRVGMRLT